MVNGQRRNQLRESHDFYSTYRQRLQSIKGLGLTWLRFGPPYSATHTGPNIYDWELMDQVMAECRALGLTVIADLLHFGLPEWLHEGRPDKPFFQNPDFPLFFAQYAAAFARRYPDIQFYTLINEPFVTTSFSARYGFWNEAKTGENGQDTAFVRATGHLAKAVILARQAIEAVWRESQRPGEPLFLQNESFEAIYCPANHPNQADVNHYNLIRFAALDLIFGHRDTFMHEYLRDHGFEVEEYEWFMTHGGSTATYLGIDHYPTCVRTYKGKHLYVHQPSDSSSLADLVATYWQRYQLPMIHTEVNAWPDHALTTCQSTYDTLGNLRQDGYPIGGMSWYGDDLQTGWHVAMRGPESYCENPVGLFHKGEPQPVAGLFSRLAAQGLPVSRPVLDLSPSVVHNTVEVW